MKFTFPPESRPLDGFTIKRAIYRGGFGEVYYGLSDAGREVALKLLHNNSDVELRGVQQCLNLSHPNLVTIFDVRQDKDGDHWIVMEYVAGETLDAAIRRHPEGMPIETVRKWLPGLVAGVGFLHSRGLVHRDLKPANLFMDNGTVKIGDVGLSKFISPSRRSAQTQSVGTVYYMAPEVAKGRYGKEVDVYAVGVILFEMLTGHVPFDGESTGEILLKHLTEKPDLTKLPPRLQGVIGKALHKEAEQRYRTMEELLKAFDDAVVGRSDPIDVPVMPCGQHTDTQRETVRSETRRSGGPRPMQDTCCSSHWAGLPLGEIWWLLPLSAFLLFIILMRLQGGVSVPLGRMSLVAVAAGCLVAWRRSQSSRKCRADGPASRTARTLRSAAAAVFRHESGPSLLGGYCGTALLTVPFVLLLTTLLAGLKPSLFTLSASGQIDPGLLGLFAVAAVAGVWVLTAVPLATRHLSPRWTTTRWCFAAAGMVVGILAWGADVYLLVDLPTSGDFRAFAVFNALGEHPLVIPGSGPTLAGYALFFAALFGIRDWQRLMHPRRGKRFSIRAVIMTLVCAWLVTKVFAFPIPWALAWGAVIACSIQLASPWEGPKRTSRG